VSSYWNQNLAYAGLAQQGGKKTGETLRKEGETRNLQKKESGGGEERCYHLRRAQNKRERKKTVEHLKSYPLGGQIWMSNKQGVGGSSEERTVLYHPAYSNRTAGNARIESSCSPAVENKMNSKKKRSLTV